jgi:hypothetical protein
MVLYLFCGTCKKIVLKIPPKYDNQRMPFRGGGHVI